MINNSAKRVNLVSLKLVRESSFLYQERYVNSPSDAANIVRVFLEDEPSERLCVVCLDTKNQPTSLAMVSQGTLNSTLVHPREIYKAAILGNANAIIVAHSHPSGIPTESKEDIEITRVLKNAGNLLGIELLDHVIIGSDGRYVSLKEKGLLD
ncbi:JAB domain-containing protein [Desulfosporosinus sp. FKA]|uniref:JAB domain-containing protein n=1 Tax=Desulfosporosinus sp. FKA TaxID=1969834 RepID=UPI000B4A0102|nr:JAB domain-containing protein [Desulfosporosinus sp. FKA]